MFEFLIVVYLFCLFFGIFTVFVEIFLFTREGKGKLRKKNILLEGQYGIFLLGNLTPVLNAYGTYLLTRETFWSMSRKEFKEFIKEDGGINTILAINKRKKKEKNKKNIQKKSPVPVVEQVNETLEKVSKNTLMKYKRLKRSDLDPKNEKNYVTYYGTIEEYEILSRRFNKVYEYVVLNYDEADVSKTVKENEMALAYINSVIQEHFDILSDRENGILLKVKGLAESFIEEIEAIRETNEMRMKQEQKRIEIEEKKKRDRILLEKKEVKTKTEKRINEEIDLIIATKKMEKN